MKLIDVLRFEDRVETFESRILEIQRAEKQIIIFGAGIGGSRICGILQEKGLQERLAGFSDNNPDKAGQQFMEFPVYRPEILFQLFPSALVIVASTAYDIIKKQLMNYGYSEHQVIYMQPARLQPEEDKKFIKENIEKYQEAFELLTDDKSRQIFVHLMNYRMTQNEVCLEKMKPYVDSELSQYFAPDLVPIEKNRIFIDAGAFTGDTIRNLYALSGTGIPCIALEPEKDIYVKLKKTVKENRWGQVVCHNIAAWNREAVLEFDSTAAVSGGGCVTETGGNRIKADAIDNLTDSDIDIGMIKMDIEGAELKALQGAEKTIRRCRPILAVCIYHKKEDFYEIPLFIKTLGINYKYYIRQYRYGQSETVLYAIPE